MANKRVRDMAASSALTGGEKFYADNGSSDVYVTANQIATFAGIGNNNNLVVDHFADTTLSTGTGFLILEGDPPSGFRRFTDEYEDGDEIIIGISDVTTGDWEISRCNFATQNIVATVANLFSSSTDWNRFNLNTVNADVTVAPDGTTTADTPRENGSNAQHLLFSDVWDLPSGNLTWSAYIKPESRTFVELEFAAGASSVDFVFAYFQLAGAGTVLTTGTGGTGTFVSASIVADGSFYRCSVTGNVNAVTGRCRIFGATADNVNSYPGTNGLIMYSVWGGQWEEGTTATTFFAGPNRIVRTEVLQSSNGNALVDFASGSKNIFKTISGPTQTDFADYRSSYVDVREFGAVGDGIVDEKVAFVAASDALHQRSAPMPAQTVTMTIASPCVVTYNPSNLDFVTIDTPVKFTTTGALPTGISADTFYYVQPPITDGTFRLGTTVNASSARDGSTWRTGTVDHPSVNTSGVQSGTHSMHIYGHKPVTLKIPPGNYVISDGFNDTVLSGGGTCRKVIIDAYGASVQGLMVGILNAQGQSWNYSTPSGPPFANYTMAYIEDADPGDTILTLTAAHQASLPLFDTGSWIMLTGTDCQSQWNDPGTWPPNSIQLEYVQIQSINPATFKFDVWPPIKYGYRKHWPRMVHGDDVTLADTYTAAYESANGGGLEYFKGGSGDARPTGGAGAVHQMSYLWDKEVEVRGLHDYSVIAQLYNINPLRRMKCVDCVFEDIGYTIGHCKEQIYENCVWRGQGFNWEVDKCTDYVYMRDCTVVANQIQAKIANPNLWVFENCRLGHFYGTGGNLVIRDSVVTFIQPAASGHNKSVVIENSIVKEIGTATENFEQGGISAAQKFFRSPDFSFANGVFTFPKVEFLNQFAPCFNLGAHMYFDSAVGTAVAPAAIDSFGLPFQILDIKEDASNLYAVTNLTELPLSSTVAPYADVTLDIASPGTVNWTAHGLSANERVCFTTTGALPTGLAAFSIALVNAGTKYFVKTVTSPDQFTVSATSGGTAINFTGTQSGVHTAYGRQFLHIANLLGPHITVRNCSGCPEIESLNGCEDLPLYSYFRRRFSGNIGSSLTVLGYSSHQAFMRGYLTELRVNVIKPYTGATGTYTLSITANGYSYSSGFVASNLSETINLKVAGERIITPDDATGDQTGDTLVSYGDWLARVVNIFTNANVADADQGMFPIVEVTIKTNQGVQTGSFGYTTSDSTTTSGGRIIDWLSLTGQPTSKQG